MFMKNQTMRKLGAALVAATLSLTAPTLPAWAGSWSEGPALETPKAHLGAIAIGGRLYVAGGSGVADPRADFESIGTGDGSWAPELSLPKGLQQFGIATDGRAIVVMGGFEAGTSEPTANVWVYDPDRSNWSARTPMPRPRAGHSAVAIGGIIYVFGGLGSDAADLWSYDIEADLWTAEGLGKLPSPRASMASATDGTRIFLIGGQAVGGAASARVDVYDPLTGEWSQFADLPRARSGAAAAVIGGTLHVAGGTSVKDMETYSRHDVLNLSGGGWQTAEPMPTARHSLASAVIDGQWYLIGGGAGAGVFSVFTASDAVEIWQP